MQSVIARETRPSGRVKLTLLRSFWPDATSLKTIIRYGFPHPGLPREVFMWRLRNLPNLFRGLRTVAWARIHKIPTHYGALWLERKNADGTRTQFGLASLRVVTTAGANFLVDALQGSVEPEILKYHGFGTGTNAEAVGDTALQTELTTQYASDNTRPTGSQAEGAGANVYRTVGTLDPDGAVTIAEHGVFSQAATGGGTLLDRSQFTGIAVAASGQQLEATYDFTITAGS